MSEIFDLCFKDTPFKESQVKQRPLFPDDDAERKRIALQSGLFDYFQAALIEVSNVSVAGNKQHNRGEALYWDRSKSTQHSESLLRHQLEHGTFDSDGMRHSAKVAWRALAQLQIELENAGAPKARGAK